MNEILTKTADVFKKNALQILGNVRKSKLVVDEEGFHLDVVSTESIPLKTAEEILNNTKKDLEGGGVKIVLTLKNISGVHTEAVDDGTTTTRIEILRFNNQEELESYTKHREEMEMRDHRKIGKQLGLWTFSKLVGSGLPLFTPKGVIIRKALQDELSLISKQYGAQEVSIPHIAKRDLYDVSGHSEKFGDELLKVISKYDEFVMKPVNCPHHTQIYASEIRSYRDLPLRYIETTAQYRDEKPGEIGGLTRVRAINLDDGHTFCRMDQIKDEVSSIIEVIRKFYTNFGLWGNHWVSLSVRDTNKDDYIGDNADWDMAENMLQSLSDTMSLDAKICVGEAAIYGPKLDFMFRDSLNRDTQLATVQIDFALPKRFKLSYIDENGSKQIPVMIHRAILGSYERFMALILEHFEGWLPAWLAPLQLAILPVSEKYTEHAETIKTIATKNNIRVEIDDSGNMLGKKIQNTKLNRIPYVVVVGEKEIEGNKYKLQNNKTGDVVFEGDKEKVIDKLFDTIKMKVLL